MILFLGLAKLLFLKLKLIFVAIFIKNDNIIWILILIIILFDKIVFGSKCRNIILVND